MLCFIYDHDNDDVCSDDGETEFVPNMYSKY